MTATALRAVTPADRDFLVEVFASTRARELSMLGADEQLRRLFVESQFSAQDAGYRQRFPRASRSVILVDGAPAGRLYLDRGKRELRLIDISLLPAFRGRGIGSVLLETLIREAAGAGVRLSLHVAAENPARRLYERLGFRYVDGGDVYVAMEWRDATRR